MNQKKKRGLAIILAIITFLLLGIAATFIFLCFSAQQNIDKTQAEVNLLQDEIASMRQTLENRQSEMDDLYEQLDDLKKEKDDSVIQIQDQPGVNGMTGTEPGAAGGDLSIDGLQVGSVLSQEEFNQLRTDEYVKSYDIVEGDDVYNRIVWKSYQPDGSTSLGNLRYLKLLHYNFEGEIQVGELIVNAALVEDFRSAFLQLLECKYQINSMYLVDNYWTGDADSSDTASINSNNTSCFNYRLTTGGSSLSQHAYGNAIDINPQQNPYVWYDENGIQQCYHENAKIYMDRQSGADHVITYDDACYQIFSSLGFTWGGDWTDVKDYQHFQKEVYS